MLPATSDDVCNSAARRVLVVDDNRATRMMLSKLIPLLAPCELQACEDGPTALATARWFVPTVVLLDIGLPGMDGLAVARRLREDERLRETLFVAVTGYDTLDDQRRIQDAGFDVFLAKPVDAGALESLLCSGPRGDATSPARRIGSSD
ncbi:MAG: response regulator [Planctomycetaceae bacterium]|nr:response regulator [Planctomycetaceae bacterium]